MSQKNITLSADERLIQLARARALHEKKTLNKVFREWLMHYAIGFSSAKNYKKVMRELSYVKVGKHFSRDELNER
jgi:hypothetical protein